MPSGASDLLSSQISFLNQAGGNGSLQDASQDAQVRRAITGARNFNSPIMMTRSQTSPQQPNAALFGKHQQQQQQQQQQAFNSTSNWPNTPNPNSAWSTGAGAQTLLQTQPTSQQWNVFNNTLNSLSNIKPQQNAPRLSGTNLSSGSISPLKQKSSQLAGSSSANAACQPTSQSLLNTQQLGGQLSPLSPNKFRQNRAPLMNVNTLNAMLMMQVGADLSAIALSFSFLIHLLARKPLAFSLKRLFARLSSLKFRL